jgi:dihydroorotase
MVRDGVTTALELEVGTGDVEGWYAQRDGGQIVNYGVSIGHIPVRMIRMADPGDFLPAGSGGSGVASGDDLGAMAEAVEAGLGAGAVGVGFGLAYTPAATTEEFEAMLTVAAAHDAPAYIHVRGGLDGVTEAITSAGVTGAPLHVVHANSSGGSDTEEFLRRIQEAVDGGQDVTTEAYPYSAGQTRIESALFDDWESYDDERFGIYQWVATGERLTRETFGRYRQEGGSVIIHSRTEEMTRAAIGSPLTMIASDGGISNGSGHPRSTGSFSKVLGRYSRDEGLFSLMDALAKMTIRPARRLEGRVPDMARKGRVRVDADADLVLFDPASVLDRSTYTEPTLTPVGIPWVIVSGTVVVEDGELVAGVRPGRAVRAPTGG